MSLIRDFVGMTIVIAVIAVYQLIMISVIGPSTDLFSLASSGQHFQAQENTRLWYDIAVLYIPGIAYCIVVAGGFVRVFRLQIASGAR